MLYGRRQTSYLRYHVCPILVGHATLGSNSNSGIPVISVEDVQVHHRELLGKVHIEALVTGNLRPDVSTLHSLRSRCSLSHVQQAKTLINTVEDILRARPCLPNERFMNRGLVIPAGK